MVLQERSSRRQLRLYAEAGEGAKTVPAAAATAAAAVLQTQQVMQLERATLAAGGRSGGPTSNAADRL